MPNGVFCVRWAHADELADLSAMEARATPYPWSSKALQGSAEAGDIIFALEVAEELTGYAVFRRVQGEAELLNVVIAKEKQGAGWGRCLLASCLSRLAGVTTVYLEVRASNKPALALYYALGFRASGQRRDYYPCRDGQREDAHLLRRDIDKVQASDYDGRFK